MTPKQIGIIGLGTMGANLARNAARTGIDVVVYNRTTSKTEQFLQEYGSEGHFVAAKSLSHCVEALEPARVLLLMVKAGDAVDDTIAELLPLLDEGDVLIDAGNSHYRDSERRAKLLEAQGIHFVGMGVSGGEEGALHGPSMMPGGNKQAVQMLLPLLRAMAADDGNEGRCVEYMGEGGAGHFVKMVHNGIEYGLMQLLAEAYHLLTVSCGLSNAEVADTLETWRGDERLQSFLLDISVDILRKKDSETRNDLLDMIEDAAAQKWTGKWTTDAAMLYGVAVPTITAGVDARIVSSAKAFRVSQHGRGIRTLADTLPAPTPDAVRDALALGMLQAYAQGFQLLTAASEAESWQLDLPSIARIWRGGCIIRAASLVHWQAALSGDESARNTLQQQFDAPAQEHLRTVVAYGALSGIPLPALSASLWYADAYRTARLPQNLTQAQRDYFGAHTYRRTDKDGVFHTDWTANA